MNIKSDLDSFGYFGGQPVFSTVRSISNLVRPDIERFLDYSKLMFDSGIYSGSGSLVRRFETRMAAFHETEHCVAFCGGFWGIVLAIKYLALPGKTEVVMPSLTYRRLGDIVAWTGLTPRFCEVDPSGLCITRETASVCINDNTALILGVHPIVNCCDAEGLEELSAECGVPLLFDAVESVYETVNGRKVGSFGRAECFSMQSSKLFNAFEGGYVTTNDGELAQSLRLMRNHGAGQPGDPETVGMNANPIEVHAAMALAAMDDVERQVVANRRRYRAYQDALGNLQQVRLVAFDENEKCGYKNIVVELLDSWPISREFTLQLLHRENMLCRPYYAPPLHQKQTGYQMLWDDLSLTERLAQRYLLLPCGHFVSEDDVRSVVSFLSSICHHGQALAAYERSKS